MTFVSTYMHFTGHHNILYVIGKGGAREVGGGGFQLVAINITDD